MPPPRRDILSEAVLREYCLHYNDERPHRNRNLRPPSCRGDPSTSIGGEVERAIRLGGLLSSYRVAAPAA